MNPTHLDQDDEALEREQRLHAFFDGELSASERAEIDALLAADPEFRGSLTEVRLLQQVVVASLDAEAEKIPDARFEQIWDEVDRTLARDARLQQAADTNVSIWSRLAAFMRPLWAPTLATAAVAAAALIYVNTGDSDANKPAQVASKDPPSAPVVAEVEPPATAEVIETDVIAFAIPDNNEAEIQRIEFGGKNGRIDRIEGKQAVTTVIWVTEEDETSDSERSL